MSSATVEEDPRECPTCGDRFASPKGMKCHHKMAHGESISGIKVSCDYCGGPTRVKPHKHQESEHTFCSHDCRGSFYSGEDHPHSAGYVECENCGEKLARPPRKHDKRNFCDSSCFGEWASKNLSGENAPNHSGDYAEAECERCGDTFEARKIRMRENKYVFCSRGCWNIWARESEEYLKYQQNRECKSDSEKSQSFSGGRWRRRREETIQRDDSECVRCGISREQHKKEYGRDLDVHHIKPRRKFEDPVKAHSEDNLVTLCRSCHRELEGLPIDLRDYE